MIDDLLDGAAYGQRSAGQHHCQGEEEEDRHIAGHDEEGLEHLEQIGR